jgi:dethiobiotin synthetase
VRGLFVTGTDTGVGKTILSAALLAAIASENGRVRAFKPVLTGVDGAGEADAGREWPQDHELLAVAAGMEPEEVAPLRYGPALSPHLAASLVDERIDPQTLIAGARTLASDEDVLIVEGVGGLLVPLDGDYTMSDFALALGLPILVAARPGLGTINHSLLTLQAARTSGLDVRAVVLTPWPGQPSELERSNRETIARLGGVEVETLAVVAGPDPAELARAGASLPWRRWLSG